MSTDPREIAEYPQPGAPPKDGIGEEDNRIPFWFSATFFGCIVFAAIYIPYYVLGDWSSAGQWASEVERAEAAYAEVRKALPTQNPYRGDSAAIAAGQEVYVATCVACHKPDGSGLVGPSLVDPYWKYGRSDEALYESVAAGRPLGMPPWAAALGTEKIWKVLAYLESLPQSSEAGVGAPEGWQPGS